MSDFIVSRDVIYDPCEFKISELIYEKESSEYGACIFKLDSTRVLFRTAKITHTKIGQFVTLWKRVGKGAIQPYDIKDDIDFFVVSVRKDNNFGQFVFPKSVLCKYDIMSNNGKGGKRAIRVYPPWDIAINKQAKYTQAWQLKYFLDATDNEGINYNRAKILFSDR